MRRKTLSVCLMLALSMSGMAQQKMSIQAQQQVAARQAGAADNATRTAGDERLTLIVEVADEGASDTYRALRAAGAEIQGVLGRQAIISTSLSSVAAIERLGGILRIDVQTPVRQTTDVALPEIGVTQIDGTSGGGTPEAYTGKGVTLYVIDHGYDFQHPAFKDASGKSRIKAVYTPVETAGMPAGKKFTYTDANAGEITAPGYLYDTPELIAQLTTDTKTDYHGTHTSAIAAGSKSPQGYRGVATDADIVLIAYPEANYLQIQKLYEGMEKGVMFAANYARQQGHHMVLNMSVGCHMGSHDGNGTMISLINEASKYGIPVISAGNEGNKLIHLHKRFTAADNKLNALLWIDETRDQLTGLAVDKVLTYGAGYSRTKAVSGQSLTCRIHVVDYEMGGKPTVAWSSEPYTIKADDTAPVRVLLEPETNADLAKHLLMGSTLSLTLAKDNGKLAVNYLATAQMLREGYVMFSFEGTGDYDFDLWDERNGFNLDKLEEYPVGDNSLSACDWAATENAITVGAYVGNTEYRPMTIDEEAQSLDELLLGKKGGLAAFSSFGPLLNGLQCPLVTAPGTNIVSAVNRYLYSDEDMAQVKESMKWEGHPYRSASGTSMACPIVSGTIALWMQAKPTLTVEEVKQVLQKSCRQDDFTAQKPERWGYGKIDAKKGLEQVLALTGIRQVEAKAAQADAVIYDLQGRRVSQPKSGIYISNGRKIVFK